MLDEPIRFRTLGDLARQAGITREQADYVIRRHGIPHTARAGNLRLFDDDAVRRVRLEVRLRNARKGGRQ